MKLRNKKTGKIKEIEPFVIGGYRSLAELNEEWEDYEEPKEDYIRVITSFIHYVEEADDSFCCDESVKKFAEKLDAYRRLKEKGFKFIGVRALGKVIDFDMPESYHRVAFDRTDVNKDQLDFYKDLDLLFGDEE